MKIRYIVSDICAVLAGWIGYRGQVIDINVARSFPGMGYGDIAGLKKEYYRHIFDLAVESLWAMAASRKKLCGSVKLINPEIVDELAGRYGKILFVLGHTGNWELIGGIVANRDGVVEDDFTSNNMYLTYKKTHNGFVDSMMCRSRRRAFRQCGNGGDILEIKEALFEIVGQRKDGKKANYFFIADQSPKENSVQVDFLGQQTRFFLGPEYLCRKMGMPMVYMGMKRVARGKYEVKFHIAAEPSRDADLYSTKGAVTRSFASLLEADILSDPVNWLWSHKRWKGR